MALQVWCSSNGDNSGTWYGNFLSGESKDDGAQALKNPDCVTAETAFGNYGDTAHELADNFRGDSEDYLIQFQLDPLLQRESIAGKSSDSTTPVEVTVCKPSTGRGSLDARVESTLNEPSDNGQRPVKPNLINITS